MPTCNACGERIGAATGVCPQCGARQTPPDSGASGRRPPQSGTRIWGCGCLVVMLACAGVLSLPKVRGAREAARRSECKNHLKEIGLALHAYHDRYSYFPPAYIADNDGRPIHSWRVLILPYLDDECRQLFAQYRFSEPWDSSANRKLLDRRPAVFSCPTRRRSASRQCTAYAAIFGPQCVFSGANPVGLDDITDGSSETMMIVEATEADIPWTKPEDVEITKRPKAGDRLGLSSDHEGGFYAVFADGSVRFMNTTQSQATFDALFTRDGDDKPGDF